MTDLRGITKFALAVAIFSAILNPVIVNAASVSDLQKQQADKQAALDKANAAAANAKAQAQTYQNQVSSLSGQITNTQSKIDTTANQITSTQSKIDSLTSTIEEKNKELAGLKVKLNNAIVEVYRFSSRSDLEVLFGGSTLSDSSNQTNYIQSVEIQVKSIFSQVQSIKDDLSKQKSDQEASKAQLDQLQSQQTSYKNSIENQKNYKNQLLGMTVQQQQAYEATADKLRNDISQISAQIYAQRVASSSGSGVMGSLGYPYKVSPDTFIVDPWNFYMSECTGYAAWYWNARLGKHWTNTQPGQGSARYWPEIARTLGYSVSNTPRVGAIISWYNTYSGDQWGHVAIVEAVNSDGTINVSEYNYLSRHDGDTRSHINPGNWGSYSYIY